MWRNLAEELFFFQYHLNMDRFSCLKLPIFERQWMIERFIQQKEKEHEQMEAEKRKAKTKR